MLCCGWLAQEALARSGFLQTRDGQTLEGAITLTNSSFAVTSTNASDPATLTVTHVALTNLSLLKFEARAPSAVTAAQGKGNGLLGYYFGNTNATGAVVVRLDQTVDFDWGAAEPARGVNRDQFKVIWTGDVEAPASGDFTFYIVTDDGGRLSVNGQVVAENWQPRAAGETNGTLKLEAGQRYPLKFECVDLSGNARARLLWSGPDTPRSIVPMERLYAASRVPNHSASIQAGQGLLAAYYQNADFTGDTFTRVDPAIDFRWNGEAPASDFSPTNFSVRWTGQVQADFTESYSFLALSDEPLRLWINERLLIKKDQPLRVEYGATMALRAGERYDIQVETANATGHGVVQVSWSSPSVTRTVVPSDHLFPSKPTSSRHAPLESATGWPPGLLLRNGAFLAGAVEKASPTAVKLSGRFETAPISTVNVAQIICQPLAQAMRQRLQPSRVGVLLFRGDFIDGEFRSLENNRLKINSILFGQRTYDTTKDVLAVVLREAAPASGHYEVQLRDRSQVRIDSLRLEPGALIIEDSMLGRVRLSAEDLMEIEWTNVPIGTGRELKP